MGKKKSVKKQAKSSKLITNVCIVLDSSGSMAAMQREAVDGYNEQVRELQKPENVKLGYRVSLVTFNTVVEDPKIWDKPISEIKELTMNDYVPNGMTALLDAIGSTISRMEKLNSNKTPPKGTNVANLLIIITDGQENNSKEHKIEVVRPLIKKLQKGNWTFTFMGANMDVMAVACKAYGISAGNIAAFVATPQGVKVASLQTMGALRAYSSSRAVGGQSVQDFYGKK
jgi:Mg-chelatase subunit ChlD